MNALLPLLLLLSVISNVSLAGHGNNQKKSESEFCGNINKAPQVHYASAPSSVFSASGRLWVVWSYAGHAYVNYSDDKATSFSPPVSVNLIPEEISARGENRPKIAIGKNGVISISWTTHLKKRFSGNIRYSYSDNDGKNFSTPITVNDNLDVTGHRFDALNVTDNGDIYIAWLDKRDKLNASKNSLKYNGAAVYYARSTDGGRNFSANKKIIDHSCECCRIAIDTDANNLPVMLWRNIYDTNTRDHTLVNFASADTPNEPQRISFDNWNIDACPHHGPDISISRNNNYHMVWFNNAEKNHGLFYARLKPGNSKTSEPVNFGNYNRMASHASVLSKNSEVWLSWKEFDGKQESIWIQYSSNNGHDWGKANLLKKTENGSDYPFLLNDNKTVYVQWQTKKEGFKLIPAMMISD